MMISLVANPTPPKVPDEGLGLIKALESAARPVILVLSPRMLPLFFALLGSTAKTAIFFPFS